jgi:putative spermidine/putrescine transport system ATP-binding protein
MERAAADSVGTDRTVRLDGIAKRYGSATVVDVPQLTIAAGEFLTLLGPSGCGKTTLLLMVAGFVRPTRGAISVGSRDITARPPEKRNFGMVFQGYALFPHLSVANNVAYPLRRRGFGSDIISRRVKDVLAKVRLSEFADHFPKQLSGGQQQRVALARSIVFEPDLVLLDEPLSALDTGLRHDLRLQLKSIHRETGTTFVCVTHDQDEALSMSDRIAVMRAGQIVQLATPQELYNRPKTRFVAGFMGAKNLISAVVVARSGNAAVCESGGLRFQQHVGARQIAAGSPLLLAMRPSALTIGPAASENEVKGIIRELHYFGSAVVVTLESPLGTLTAEHPADRIDSRFMVGGEIVAAWRPDAPIIVDDA